MRIARTGSRLCRGSIEPSFLRRYHDAGGRRRMVAANPGLSPEDAERFRSFERQRHDSLAATYHDFFTPVTALAIKPLLDAVRLYAGAHLLDVATGPGSLAAEALGFGARPIGIDISPGMIAMAGNAYPGIDFHVAEVEHLPFADRSFDALVCNFGLGHFPYPESAITECVRTLKPGGRIPVALVGDPSRGRCREAVAESGPAPPSDVPACYSIFRFSDTDELRRLLDGAGLTEVAVRDHRTTYLVADVDTLWRGGLGEFAVTSSAIASQKAATQAAIRAALERRAAVYQIAKGLMLPIAFKIGSARKPG